MIESVQGTSQSGSVSQVEAEKQRLRKACQEFESIMNQYMLKSMRQTVVRAEEPGQGREIYEEMMDEALASEMSKCGGKGLSELLYHQLAPMIHQGRGTPNEA